MQKTKREVLNGTSTLIEQIRTEINTGRCNGCMTCNKVSELHDLLVQLLVLIKDDYPIECEQLQKRTNRLVGCVKINPYDFGAIQELISLLVKRENDAAVGQSSSVQVSGKRIFISHSSKEISTMFRSLSIKYWLWVLVSTLTISSVLRLKI